MSLVTFLCVWIFEGDGGGAVSGKETVKRRLRDVWGFFCTWPVLTLFFVFEPQLLSCKGRSGCSCSFVVVFYLLVGLFHCTVTSPWT